ncbi:MAG TPA: hypothetical protein VNY09_08260 [Candidatus Sulfotelmatobacter sp.]|nr:hypothetical protein [Candidatus Sulfotelmatobacter sp.]
MRNRAINLALALLVAAIDWTAISSRAQAQQPAASTQTAASTPDLSGLWSRLRDGAVAHGYEDYVLDFGKSDSPMTPWAAAKYRITGAMYHGTDPKTVMSDPVFQCFPPGVPRIYLFNFPVQIVQIPGQVLMLFEYDHFVRRIYTDGRAHDADQGPLWMGDSIGKWEGDTLVVDTVNFNDKTLIDRVGRPHSDALHVVERIRRIDAKFMEVAFTVNDSKAYTKPWGTKLIFESKPDWKIMEQICEDNASFIDFNKKATATPKK